MMIIRKDSLIKFLNMVMIDLPAPINLSYAWNFGSLLSLCLMVQILTGFLLTMHYSPNISIAFSSVVYICHDINYGWLMKHTHSNGASMFFMCLYMHMGRGMYFMNYDKKMVWTVGVVIYIASMATAFMGYLLPWGQMSFWGATVITNMFSAIPYLGELIVMWLWGGFAVNNATLNRFFAFHFILPFIIGVLAGLHLILLHSVGSSNPLGTNSNFMKTLFYPHFLFKDLKGFILLLIFLSLLVFFYPNFLSESENYIPANPLVTPTHIKPEWYFLWAYAILRSIPNKLGGVLMMVFSIVILFFIPIMWNKSINMNFSVLNQINIWILIASFLILTWIGASPVEHPYDMIGFVMMCIYLSMFFILMMIKILIKFIYYN